MQVNFDEVMRWYEFQKKVNSVPLGEIVWYRDSGETIKVDPALLEEWKFIGMCNTTFAEMFLSRVVNGEEQELMKELE